MAVNGSPMPRLGRHPAQRQVGSGGPARVVVWWWRRRQCAEAARAGGARTRARGGEPSPAKPGRELARRGVRSAKAKAARLSNLATEGAEEELRGAAPGDGERAARPGGQRHRGAVLPRL